MQPKNKVFFPQWWNSLLWEYMKMITGELLIAYSYFPQKVLRGKILKLKWLRQEQDCFSQSLRFQRNNWVLLSFTKIRLSIPSRIRRRSLPIIKRITWNLPRVHQRNSSCSWTRGYYALNGEHKQKKKRHGKIIT